MEGLPLEIHVVDQEAKPIAVHIHNPVPLHWQREVKDSIDRDVKHGVLEAVPVGEPVPWCLRMVMGQKNNNKSGRTVGMQVLHKHAVRETNHTQSPFHKATLVPSRTYKTLTSPMLGTGILVCQSEKKSAPSLRSHDMRWESLQNLPTGLR